MSTEPGLDVSLFALQRKLLHFPTTTPSGLFLALWFVIVAIVIPTKTKQNATSPHGFKVAIEIAFLYLS
jgi:hypothetical protein